MKNSFLVLLSLMVAFHFSSAANGINYLDKASTRKTANLSEIFASDPLYAVSGDENPKPRTTGSGPGTTAEIAASQYFVSPAGSAAGTGSMASPWDLKTALSQPAAVKPGDTIYLRGGTYNVPAADLGFTSNLTGTASSPIKVMSYPGEWAVIDGNVSFSAVKSKTILLVVGAYTWFMNFEITNSEPGTRKIAVTGSNPSERRANSIDDAGTSTKIINLIIHDTGQGIASGNDVSGNEYYGNVIYNNGWDAPDRTHGHGGYIQSGTGPKNLEDNFFFNNFADNTQMYGSGSTGNRNVTWIGNAFFNGDQTWWGPNITNLVVKENYTYKQIFKLGQNLDISNTSADIQNNYFMSGVFMDELAQAVTFRNNTVWRDSNDPTVMLQVRNFWAPSKFSIDNNVYYKSPTSPGVGQMRVIYNGSKKWLPIIKRFNGEFAFNKVTGSQVNAYLITKRSWQDDFRFDMNTTYIDSVPAGTKVFVRKNKYDPGRSNIVIYNWDQASTVNIDASSTLTPGDSYELHSVQDYFGDVQTGVYGGGPLSVNMSGRSMARPIGYDQVTAWYHDPLQQNTFPKFGAFILIKK